MARPIRLLELIQALRRNRRAVSAAKLAEELGVSRRTIYRDIETLVTLGAPIDGEAGVGYVLRPGFMLPPLMFTEEELDALALGGLWVSQRADQKVAIAAKNALAKIAAVLPVQLMACLEIPALLSAPAHAPTADGCDPAIIRSAIRHERKMQLTYIDEAGACSERVVWPIALVYFDAVRVLVAWCETRSAFRHFRIDRISAASDMNVQYPRRRHALLKVWHELDVASGRRKKNNTADRN